MGDGAGAMDTTSDITIKRVHTLLDLVISTAVFAAGVGVYFLLPGWGILFCFIGVLLFGFYKRSSRRVGEKTLLKEKSLDLAVSCRDSIMGFAAMCSRPGLPGKDSSLCAVAGPPRPSQLHIAAKNTPFSPPQLHIAPDFFQDHISNCT